MLTLIPDVSGATSGSKNHKELSRYVHCGHLLTGGPALYVNINAYGQPTNMCTVFASIELERALVDAALLSALVAPLCMQSVKASELQNHSNTFIHILLIGHLN